MVEYGSTSWDRPEGVVSIPVQTAGYYAVQVPEHGVAKSTKLLLALHGWGQNSRSFLRKFSSFRKSNVLVVAPQAPHQFYLDMNSRKVGFGWMTGYDRHRAISDIAHLLDSVLIDVERSHGILGAPFLLGFSQGVSVAYRYAMLGARPAAGVIACGGDMPPEVAERLSERPPFPVLLVHGRKDTIVPIAKCEAAAADLLAARYPYDTLHFDGEHDIPSEIMERVHDWMEGVGVDAGQTADGGTATG